ncbi:rhomboid family intramembrane serine protease [Lentisphaerota bacterium ZTH]|nr:rhomboid family intramembrane serine protease [Lentisphaerota bacterium]WET05717.1 rhomboid family intramembrane serine protease [Lentisphaerota bacterium ZTH]
MLSDRDYMNNPRGRTPGRIGLGSNSVVYWLIGINVIFFLMIPLNSELFSRLAMSSFGIKAGMYWQIITAMFLHGGFTHILFNMWGLYLFGTLIAPRMGTVRFLLMYFISGISGNLLWLLFNWNSPYPVVGASGALFGVLIATAMLEPNREFIMLFFPMPMKCKTLVMVYAVLEIFLELRGGGNVAHLAHLGGLVGGYIYIRIFCKQLIAWDIWDLFSKKKRMPKNDARFRGWKVHNAKSWNAGSSGMDFERHEKDENAQVSQKELDHLLDKVSRSGINSLTKAEMAALRKAREQMRRR